MRDYGSPWTTMAFWVAMLFWLLVIIVPIVKVLKRTGHSRAWAILFAVPLVNVIALWVFAFKRWPIDPPNT